MRRRAVSLRPAPRAARRTHGFTILELALTLAVIGIIAVGVLVPFVAQVSTRKISDTERILEQAKETLLGFAAATGRLPCPAIDFGVSTGVEAFQGPPAQQGTAANGLCASYYGFLPAVTLGFTPVDERGFAIDAWMSPANRIRYAVAPVITRLDGTIVANTPFTRTNGVRDVTPREVVLQDTTGNVLLAVCSGGTAANGALGLCGGGTQTLTRNAPVVLWSSGANAARGGNNVDERENPHANAAAAPAYGVADRVFVSRNHATLGNYEFDDIVTWISGSLLVGRMIQGGQLP